MKKHVSMNSLIKTVQPYLYLLPGFLFLATFTHYPIIRTFYLSFFRQNLSLPQKQFIGVENYVLATKTPLFWEVFGNNLLYALGTIPTSLILGLLFALLINQKIRGITIYRVAIFYPVVIPMAAAAMIWLWMLTPTYGLVNYYGRKLLGLPDINWLGEPNLALWALVAVGIWKRVGYYMIIFLAGLQVIPTHLYEAAILDGANAWKRFWKITLPLLSPTTFFLSVIAVIDSFQAIDQVYLMTHGGPGNATNLFIYYIYLNAFRFFDMGYASTVSSVLFVILLGLTVLAFKFLHKRVHYE
jgi:sn-glycerol 3-phosphate transport system permease protein